MSRLLGHAGFELGFAESAPVSIGPDVWIGARVIVADGVKIGIGAIIGANTVVTKDVPPYAVVYGSPPSVRRFRFPAETIQRLDESRWWLRRPEELSVEELRALSHSREAVDHS